MKTTIITAIAVMLGTAAMADTKIVQGCEVVDKGGYSNKVDPNCQFNHNSGGNDGVNSGLTLQELIDVLNNLGS